MSAADSSTPRVGVVVLTQGRRPEELRAGLASVLAQRDVEVDVVVVGNGADPADLGLPGGVAAVALPENVGIPAGRNAGVPRVEGDWLFFLDDDASIPSPTFLIEAIGIIRADPRIGMIQPRVDDPAGGPAPRRWIPRIRKGDPRRSSTMLTAWEGAVVLPRVAFEEAGGWGDEYFYAHEGIELAWRIWDTGRRAWYAGDLVALHPVIQPTRHSQYYRLTARNRVWLARRNLPTPLIPIYTGSWFLVQMLRSARGGGEGREAWLRGWREGWRTDPGIRRPLGWRTVLRMTAAGRPPVI
ncbi:MAG: glycosyltransferase [Naasia sp.]